MFKLPLDSTSLWQKWHQCFEFVPCHILTIHARCETHSLAGASAHHACRHNAAVALLNTTLVVHGGEATDGTVFADMAALDLQPIVNAWPLDEQLTCTQLSVALAGVLPAQWLPEGRICHTAVGPVTQHGMSAVPASASAGSPAEGLLLHGGVRSGNFALVCFHALDIPVTFKCCEHGSSSRCNSSSRCSAVPVLVVITAA